MTDAAMVALTMFQGGIESVRGTAVAATRKMGLNGWFVANDDLHSVSEQRNTFIENFRQFKTKRWAELRGLTTSPTFEDLAWYLLGFAKGGVTPSTVDVSAYLRAFSPAFNTDDLATATLEAASPIQDFAFPYCLGDRIELEFFADKAAVMTLDYLAQRAIEQARTGSLSDRDTEDINGALGQAYIDTTTIGSTLNASVTRAKFTLQNNWVQLFTFNGLLHSTKAYRKVRSMALELDIVFDAVAEYDAFLAATDRKVRYHVDGSVVGATTAKKYLDVDFYGKWGAYPLADDNGVLKARATAVSKYDSGATKDWAINVQNGVAVLP